MSWYKPHLLGAPGQAGCSGDLASSVHLVGTGLTELTSQGASPARGRSSAELSGGCSAGPALTLLSQLGVSENSGARGPAMPGPGDLDRL